MHWKTGCSIAATVLLFPAVSQAADYYVSTAGSDSAAGSQASPFRTIQYAADTATSPGDTVHIMGGTYNEAGRAIRYFSGDGIVLTHSGSQGNPITFKPLAGHEGQVIVDLCTTGPTTNCPTNSGVRTRAGFVLGPGTSHVTIEGLEIRNASTGGIWVAASPSEAYSVGLVIRKNHIHHTWGGDNTGGIRPDVTDGILIEDNVIHDTIGGAANGTAQNGSGIHSYEMKNAIIRGNEIYSGTGNGIRDKWPDLVGNVLIENNRIHDVAVGIRIGGATGSDVAHDHRISHNVIYNTEACLRTVPELVPPTTKMQIWNNTFVDCGSGLSIAHYPDTQIWNNIIVDGSGGAAAMMSIENAYHDPGGGADQHIAMSANITKSDCNLFYFYPAAAGHQPFLIEEVPESLAQWKARGYDAHSVSADPLFIDKAAHDFGLRAGSPALGAGCDGSDLGAGGAGAIVGVDGGGDGAAPDGATADGGARRDAGGVSPDGSAPGAADGGNGGNGVTPGSGAPMPAGCDCRVGEGPGRESGVLSLLSLTVALAFRSRRGNSGARADRPQN